jgi:hypothetical protein
LLIILPIYVAVLLLLKAVKGLLLLLDPVASRNSEPIPASSSRLDEIHYFVDRP